MKRRLLLRAAAVCAASMLVSEAAHASAAPATTGGVATAYQMNAEHNGYSRDGVAAPPLKRKWLRDLGGAVSYPVIANGKVFVTVAAQDGYGTVLRALDVETGKDVWKPLRMRHSYRWSALTLGAGRLYVLTGSATLTAHDINTGKLLWTRKLPNQSSSTAAPTYRGGMVYATAVGTGATMYAVHAATGTVTWRQKILGGNQSSPAVTTDGIYVSYSCQYTYRLVLRTGATTWKYAPSCYGAGGRTAVVAAGSLWVRDPQRQYPAAALSLTDGTPRATFSMNNDDMRAPAFLGRTGFFNANGMLQARSTQTPNKSLWTFLDNRRITSAPIVVNGYVYAGSEDGHIYAINPLTGRTVWSAPLGAPVLPPDEHNLSEPLTGLAAGQGILAVPATNLLVAYGK